MECSEWKKLVSEMHDLKFRIAGTEGKISISPFIHFQKLTESELKSAYARLAEIKKILG